MIGRLVRAASAAAALCWLAGCGRSGDSLAAKAIPSVSTVNAALFSAKQHQNETPLVPEDWLRQDFPDWGFSALFPHLPERVERPSGRWMYRCDVDRLDYMLRFDPVVGHPAGINSDDPEEILMRAIQMRADRFAAKPIESRRMFFRGMRTIRTVLLDLDLERLFYWQHSYDHRTHTLLVMAISARSVDGQKQADLFFNSYQPLAPRPVTEPLTVAGFHKGQTALDAHRRAAEIRAVEVTGVVSDVRVEPGEFDVRHRLVTLADESSGTAEKPSAVVRCSMNGAPWDKLSPGARATIRAYDIGLPSGTLVNGEIVQSEGEPCPTLPSSNLLAEFASDSQAAGQKYGGRCVVISGLLDSASDGLASRDNSLVFRGPSGGQVVCALAPAGGHAEMNSNPPHTATVIGRLSNSSETGRPILISDCYVIEIAKP